MLLLQCASGTATIDCTFSMDIPTSKVTLLAKQQSRTTAQFIDGRLLAIFGDIVNGWFQELGAFAVAASARTAANSTFRYVSVEVVNRFLSQAGSPFPTDLFASSIKSRCRGLRPNLTIFDFSVCHFHDAVFHKCLLIFGYLHVTPFDDCIQASHFISCVDSDRSYLVNRATRVFFCFTSLVLKPKQTYLALA